RREGRRHVRPERHGPLSRERMDARGGRGAAQPRDQAVGRGDPRQQHLGSVAGGFVAGGEAPDRSRGKYAALGAETRELNRRSPRRRSRVSARYARILAEYSVRRLDPGYDATCATGATFSFVTDSGIWAPYLSPSFTFGTVSRTSVIGRPWVGAMVFTPSRSIRWSSRSQ